MGHRRQRDADPRDVGRLRARRRPIRAGRQRTPRSRSTARRREPDRRHPRGAARVAERATCGSTRTRSRRTPARCRPSRRPRPTSRAPTTRPAPRSASSSTRSTSARAGSRRCASRPGSPASARSRPGCDAAGRGPLTSCRTITREEIAATLGQDPEHELMGHFERHLRELGTKVDSFLAFARSGTVEELATELASWDTWYDISPYGDDRDPVLQARPDRRRRPRALRAGRPDRPRPPDAVRRQPRPARAAASTACSTFDDDLVARDRARRADRARLARGGRDPRLRAARGRAARPSPRQHDRDRRRQRALAPRRRAALQGAPPPPCPHHRLLTSSGSRASTRSSTRCGSAPRSSRSPATVNRRSGSRSSSRPTSTLPEMGARRRDRRVREAPAASTCTDALARPGPGGLPRGAAPARQPRRGDPGRRGRRRRRGAHHRAIPGTRWPSAAPRGCSSRSRSVRSRRCPRGRALIAIDPEGEERPAPRDAILAFGSERHGLSEALKHAPTRASGSRCAPGVSSLNLATAVAAVLYAGSG